MARSALHLLQSPAVKLARRPLYRILSDRSKIGGVGRENVSVVEVDNVMVLSLRECSGVGWNIFSKPNDTP